MDEDNNSLNCNEGDKMEASKQSLKDLDDMFVSQTNACFTPLAARESVVRYQMLEKERDYTYSQNIRVFVGTWNVNGRPAPKSLAYWLQVDAEPPDIYAIGFQELDLSKEAFLFNDSPREEEWLSAVIANSHHKAKYRKIALVRLVGMMLIVLVKEQHVAYIRGMTTDSVGTGIMGKLGNKGGVAVRFDIHNTSMCFVNAHLAAHVDEFERRNQDYHDICSRISFQKFLPPKSIKDHDHVFFFGDLNYRITDLDASYVKHLIDKCEFENILSYDQLRKNLITKKAFDNYQEGAISFKPTYKYDMGTDDWDSSEKNRGPSWCDRILWKGDRISQLAYRSHPALKISDHKPVSASFDAEIRVIDAIKYRKIHEEVMKKLDKLENEFLPQVMVDTTDIFFGNVKFLEPLFAGLIVANTGQVPVQFSFIEKNDDKSYCKDWLNVKPYIGFIMPGEKCDVKIEMYVDKRSACKLNCGKDKLYDILVLHLQGGKDIFITVSGNYEHSCFGSSLEALCRISVPVGEIPQKEFIELNCGIGSAEARYSVPKEIWFLVDHLYRHALKEENLFEQPGLHSELLQIRDWLDKGSLEAFQGSVHSVAEALMLLLDALPEPLVPYKLHDQCLAGSSSFVQCKQIVTQLPEYARKVFSYLCLFLRELLIHSEDNKLDSKTLATLFGSIFIRELPEKRTTRVDTRILDRKKANFVYHFLVNDCSDIIGERM